MHFVKLPLAYDDSLRGWQKSSSPIYVNPEQVQYVRHQTSCVSMIGLNGLEHPVYMPADQVIEALS